MVSKLADALKQDDNAEDSSMHGDDRAICHQCQIWADHAHGPVGNARITQEGVPGDPSAAWPLT